MATSNTTRTLLHLLTTNDLHSCGDGYAGISRSMRTIIENWMTTPDSNGGELHIPLKVDAGDWYSGSIYSLLGPNPRFERENPELDFFQDEGYAAVNVGNHEFDSSMSGFARMLAKASARGFRNLVSTNMVVERASVIAKYHSNDVHAPNVLNEVVITELGGAQGKVAFFGVMGEDAAFGCRANTISTGVSFLNARETIKKCVECALRCAEREPSLRGVVVLFHGGERECERFLEGYERNNACPPLLFIVSAHTHERFRARSWERRISQAGAHGEDVGWHTIDIGAKQKRLMKSAIVKVEEKGRHPAFERTVVPLVYAELKREYACEVSAANNPLVFDVSRYGNNSLIGRLSLPLIRQVNDERGDAFSSAVATCILRQINADYFEDRGTVKGFFLANELIRCDFTRHLLDGKLLVSFETLVECLETTRPALVPKNNTQCHEINDDTQCPLLGCGIVVVETSRWKLRLFLRYVLNFFAVRLVTADALVTWSDGIFDEDAGNKIVVATTDFMYRSIVRFYDFSERVVKIIPNASLSVLVFKYLNGVAAARGE